jgi:putative membrane protein
MRPLTGPIVLLLSALAGPALAHGTPVSPTQFDWSRDPWVVAPLALSLALFLAGRVRLGRRAVRGAPDLARRTGAFLVGWAALALALVSPLHQAGERSFTAHMIEHEMMMLLAAPLLVAARPLAVMIWAFPARGRRLLGRMARGGGIATAWRRATDPLTATLVQAAALWLWHTPALFDRALASDGWHIAQHLSFLVSALLFWSAMLQGARRNRGLAALCLFATSVVSGALGAMMAFSVSPWYAGYARLGMAPFSLTPMQDQQLAGMLMWVPGGLIHALAALAAIAAILTAPHPASARPIHGLG